MSNPEGTGRAGGNAAAATTSSVDRFFEHMDERRVVEAAETAIWLTESVAHRKARREFAKHMENMSRNPEPQPQRPPTCGAEAGRIDNSW